MNTIWRGILVIVLIVAAAGAGFWLGRHHADESPDQESATQPADENKATPAITVARVKQGEINDTIRAYGSVIADPGEVRVLSVQFESRIARVQVTPGQEVQAGTEVILIDPSPDARVALQDARNALDAATNDLEQARQRFNDHLATNQELSQAAVALKSAELKVKSLVDRGVDQSQHLNAPGAGVVSKVDVQEGQIIAAGSPLIEIAASNRILGKLGVEPSDASHLKPGQEVTLHRIESSSEPDLYGKIRVVGQRVDPATRLVELIVTLPSDVTLVLDSFISGEMTRSTTQGLIVPSSAILADDDNTFALFTIKDGKASKHTVHPGIANGGDVLITGDDVHDGDMVALTGSLELEDGMHVEVKDATTEPSEPTTEKSKTEGSP